MKRFALVCAAALAFMVLAAPAFAEEGSKWDSFTLAPKLGYAYFAETSGAGKVAKRNALSLFVDFDFGGEGAGFDLAFNYNLEDPELGNKMHALGAYLGFAYRLHFGDWYPYFGIGLRGAYLMADWIDQGAEIYGRIPIGVTYYILEDLGLVLELGLGYGITGISAPGVSFDIGHGFALDVMAGIRWP
ncbi:MAG: hypothetical protein C4523_03905 [Myxococcales bacterium]|nr:MAG: hypothetical protein C4523_03905 [Myxococcales bacterium]